MKTPLAVIEDSMRHTSSAPYLVSASAVVSDLRTAGYIIVRKGAIGQAQDEAVRQYKADNDNRATLPVVGTLG